jgi:hypothetical protein
MPQLHGDPPRGGQTAVRSHLLEGRFGRMFRRLPPAPDYPEQDLIALAESMRDDPPPAAQGGWTPAQNDDRDNSAIPAGYTYFGQFVDHDITFDPASSLQKKNDPDALVDFRSPRFDLDSVYGSGPDDEPFQYDQASGGTKLLVEANHNNIEDLPRNSQGRALIGDPRNDENTIVGQLQLVFLKLHNKLVDELAAAGTPADRLFEEAQRATRWHYQWVVATDFLPRVAGQETVDRIWQPGADEMKPRFYKPQKHPYMPVEFSAAAFRFGHSQVRGIYDLNGAVTQRPIFAPGDEVGELDDLRGFRPLPSGWTIEWPRFLQIGETAPQPSRKLDARLVPALFDLPGRPAAEHQSLALLNLLRGQALSLPSGQDVAKAMREHVHSGAELAAPDPTPLWFYILKEAELHRQNEGLGGQQLGPVGGRIVAEVLLGLLRTDPGSFFSAEPGWTPSAAGLLADADSDGRFTLADLVVAAAP